jgi:hypothetical protein
MVRNRCFGLFALIWRSATICPADVIDYLKKLEHLRGLHGRDVAFFNRLNQVRQWQHHRLQRTYRDLATDARHAPAVAFFLDELYGNTESALRDRDLLRMMPTIQRVLPAFALETVNKALQLDVISEEFDQALTRHLDGAKLDEASYIAAFRESSTELDRLHQVALMREVGEQLERVVKKPLINSTLRMLRTPARLAGLAHMQQFLEKGFDAFRHLNGADYFLDTVARRETLLIERIFGGDPAPFRLLDELAP